ncbi:MAG: hypothetical protein ABW321_10985 [Polyangiales bacterium]
MSKVVLFSAALWVLATSVGCKNSTDGLRAAPPPNETPAAPRTAAGAGPTPAGTGQMIGAVEAGSGGTAGSQPSAAGVIAALPSDDAGISADDDTYLGLAEPTRGFRLITKGREIPPGADVEYCELAELPGAESDVYLVTETELANGTGSHHLIVSAALPGSAADRQLRQHDIGDQLPCVAAAIEFGQDGLLSVAGAQTTYAKATYPSGVALRLHGGQRIVFDYHYFNVGDEPLMAQSALAVHTLPPDSKVTVASSFSFTNMTLDTPPRSEQTFTATCTFKHDLMLNGLGRHTHQHGTDFTVWFDGGAKDGEKIWTSVDWEHDTVHTFDAPILVKAGEGFKFACGFRNESDAPLRFGISAADEMCILSGTVWSPTAGQEVEPEACVISWIDEQGVGRSADDGEGFPVAALPDALTCHTGTLGLGLFDACIACVCDSCASIISRCSEDADCKPLLDCRNGCGSGSNCDEQCEPLMFEHSSAVGMVTRVGECMSKRCGTDCALEAAP